MCVRTAAILLVYASLSLKAQGPPAAASPCNNTPAYSTCELTFDLTGADQTSHPNPYRSVELKVEFRSPRHRTLSMPGYWDGGRRLVVRFSPTEAGDWDYHVTSNIAAWNDKTGSFTAASSPSQGFIVPANMHHWAYTEKTTDGLYQAHLWMGTTELLFGNVDDAAFRQLADARSAQKFNHLRGLVLSQPMGGGAYTATDTPNVSWFQRLDGRVLYLNQKGIIVDLILAGGPANLVRMFPSWEDRRRFVRYVAGRYAAMNVTWQGVEAFEDYPQGRALLKEIGGVLKEADPYQHPRTTGAHLTSTPLVDDGWMNFAAVGAADDQLGAVEHQLYPVPFVNVGLGREAGGAGKAGASDVDADTLRHRLWNATMDGQYVTYASTGTGGVPLNSPGTKAMTAWFDFFSGTRHWELEPYFDVDGGRALSLEGVEYVVYIEKPGPIELSVVKHGYDVFWVNPIDGENVRKKFSGEHFTGEPPDRSHDWVLHVVRETHMESMNRSYKLDSREYPLELQQVEANTPKVPFAIEQPVGDLSFAKPVAYAAKITRETRATRSMMWVWMGEVAADRQGYRVLATGQKGTFQLPRDLAENFPATMHLRLYGMNANGKVYEVDAACQINP